MAMVLQYAARIEDLGPGDFVRECIAWGSHLADCVCRLRFGTPAALPGVRCAREDGCVDQMGCESCKPSYWRRTGDPH